MTTTKITPLEYVKATFVHVYFDRIGGEPIYDSLSKMERQAARNAAET